VAQRAAADAGRAGLNARAYTLFDLTPVEIAIIEQSAKYRYGEV
jgi:hypothetical protein